MRSAEYALAVGRDLFAYPERLSVRPADRYETARLAWAVRVSGWSGPSMRSQSAATCSSISMASSMCPADQYDEARFAWTARVSGWSGP